MIRILSNPRIRQSPKIHFRVFAQPKFSFETVFLIIYGVYIFVMEMNDSFFGVYLTGYIRYFPYLCIAVLLMCECFSRRFDIDQTTVLLLFLFLAINAILAESKDLLFLLVFLYTGRKVDFRAIVKLTIGITLFVLVLVPLSTKIGIIQNQIIGSASRRREFVGFRYALYGPALLNNVTMLIVWLRRDKISYSELIGIFLINAWYYYKTDSRLSFLLSLFVIFVAFILKIDPMFLQKRNLVLNVLCFSFIIGFLISILLTLSYNSHVPWMQNLNTILADRLAVGREAFSRYGVPILARKIRWVGHGLDVRGLNSVGSYMYVDSLYLKILINYGVVCFMLIIFVLTAVMCCLKQKRDICMLLMFFVLAVHFAIDDLPMYLPYNTFFFAVIPILSQRSAKASLISSPKRITLS